ncbi:MAG: xanthine phosphoribosyltransferase [Clostridiales bacterium]|jgi:xanthine phosphoribosyltransferase|nr:xanthine phosphoribosyltransferase [Clostridiales bacterium]
MNLLQAKIVEKGQILPGGILKVDSFLNHCMDWEVYKWMGEEFYRLFKDDGVTRILTVEASGIGIAAVAAQSFHLPAVFARKTEGKNMDSDIFSTQVRSYTRDREYKITVSKSHILPSDRVLLLDDFLANGQALMGLYSIVQDAGATLVGCGIAIEKSFQPGGALMRSKGVRVESLAVIKEMTENGIAFE